MKGLLVRLAGGYVGLGALAFALHRARYLETSRVRQWTDNQSREMEAQLTAMREELDAVRTELRTQRAQRAEQAPAAMSQMPSPAPAQAAAPTPLPQKKRNRRPRKEAPVVEGPLAA